MMELLIEIALAGAFAVTTFVVAFPVQLAAFSLVFFPSVFVLDAARVRLGLPPVDKRPEVLGSKWAAWAFAMVMVLAIASQ